MLESGPWWEVNDAWRPGMDIWVDAPEDLESPVPLEPLQLVYVTSYPLQKETTFTLQMEASGRRVERETNGAEPPTKGEAKSSSSFAFTEARTW